MSEESLQNPPLTAEALQARADALAAAQASGQETPDHIKEEVDKLKADVDAFVSKQEAHPEPVTTAVEQQVVAPVSASKIELDPYKIYLNQQGHYYAGRAKNDPGDATIPNPSRNMFDSLVTLAEQALASNSGTIATVSIHDMHLATANEGNGEVHSMPRSGIVI